MSNSQRLDRIIGVALSVTGGVVALIAHAFVIRYFLIKYETSRPKEEGDIRSHPEEKQKESGLVLHRGACHCERVRFRIRAPSILTTFDVKSSKIRSSLCPISEIKWLHLCADIHGCLFPAKILKLSPRNHFSRYTRLRVAKTPLECTLSAVFVAFMFSFRHQRNLSKFMSMWTAWTSPRLNEHEPLINLSTTHMHVLRQTKLPNLSIEGAVELWLSSQCFRLYRPWCIFSRAHMHMCVCRTTASALLWKAGVFWRAWPPLCLGLGKPMIQAASTGPRMWKWLFRCRCPCPLLHFPLLSTVPVRTRWAQCPRKVASASPCRHRWERWEKFQWTRRCIVSWDDISHTTWSPTPMVGATTRVEGVVWCRICCTRCLCGVVWTSQGW